VISTGGTPVIKMTGAGEIYANKYYGDGASLTGVTGTGDNLGNHTATSNLLMGGNSIYNAYNITSTGWVSANIYQIYGAGDVLRVSGGDPVTSLSLGRGAHSMSGGNNVLIGNSAGSSITTGYSNTLVGAEAGQYMVASYGNIAIGQRTGQSLNDTSGFNTFVGIDVGHSGVTGNKNTCIGAFSCNSATSFAENVTLGYQAGLNFTSGYSNIFIGNDAAKDLLTGNNNIVLDYAGKLSSTDASNELNIGGVIFGNLDAKTVGISTRVPQGALDVVSTGTANNQYAQIWRDSNGTIKSSMSATGVLMATKFIGDGSGLTGMSGDNLGNHTATTNLTMGGFNINGAGDIAMSKAYFNPNVEISLAASSQLGGVYISSNIYIAGTSLINGQNASGYSLSLSSGINMPNGTVTAGLFNGSGASLTSLNASSLASGTVIDSRLSSNVDLLDANKTVSGNKTFTGTVALPTRDKITFSNELHNSSSTIIRDYSTRETSSFYCVLNSSLTIYTNGGRVMIGFAGGWDNTVSGATNLLSVKIDGANWSGTQGIVTTVIPQAGYNQNASFSVVSNPLPVGYHEFCIAMRVLSDTGRLRNIVNTHTNQFWVQELR